LLEYQARWAIATRLVDQGAVPDYLELIHSGALRQLKPEAVTLIQ
ncbi:MAG: hypothetical protein H6R26_2033, partial [Proteobacteria bacterium]|nr:hypothetical protein [Pseudomonadota bacterium]